MRAVRPASIVVVLLVVGASSCTKAQRSGSRLPKLQFAGDSITFFSADDINAHYAGRYDVAIDATPGSTPTRSHPTFRTTPDRRRPSRSSSSARTTPTTSRIRCRMNPRAHRHVAQVNASPRPVQRTLSRIDVCRFRDREHTQPVVASRIRVGDQRPHPGQVRTRRRLGRRVEGELLRRPRRPASERDRATSPARHRGSRDSASCPRS